MNKREKKSKQGFTLVEIIVTTAIIGTLSAIAIPSYFSQMCKAETSEAQATIESIKAIMAAYVDETGNLPTTWDDLGSITAIMTANGLATGDLETPITTPNKTYQISINGPNFSIYNMHGEPANGCDNFKIMACFNLSTGASDLRRGNGKNPTETPVCI